MNPGKLFSVSFALGLAVAGAQAVEIVPAATLANRHASQEVAISSRNVDQLQQAWTFETEAPVSHTPLFEGGRIYFADWSGKVYALDASTGEVAWERQVQESVMKGWPWHGFAGTGALSGDLLIEASTEGTAYGIDKETGEVVWQTEIAEDPQAGSIGKLTAYDGLVYIGLSSVEEPLSVKLPPEEINFQGKVIALDAQTGELVWERPLVTEPHNGVAVWSSFAVDPATDTLYFTTGNNYTGKATPLADALVAVNAKTGELLWHRQVTQHDIWTKADPKGPDYDFGAGPQLFEATIDGQTRQLVAAGQKSGVFYVWDRLTGEPIWSHTVGYGHIGGGIHGEASIGDGRVYIWGNNSFPYSNPKQHPMDITAVDAATGEAFWTLPKAQPALQISAGFLANDVYFVGSLDGMVRAYRASDGKLLWTSQPHGAVASSLWVEDDLLFWGGSVPKNWGGAAQPNGVFAYAVGGQADLGASAASAQAGVTGGTMTGGMTGGSTSTAGAVSPEEFATLQTAAYEIYPSEGFDVNGTVQVVENVDGGARVTVTLQDTESGRMYPSHFHTGDCGSGGEIVYPLELIPGGPESMVTTIEASVFDVINSDLYINIHEPDDLSTIVACGEVGLGANDQWR